MQSPHPVHLSQCTKAIYIEISSLPISYDSYRQEAFFHDNLSKVENTRKIWAHGQMERHRFVIKHMTPLSETQTVELLQELLLKRSGIFVDIIDLLI
jgi:hypothetical protein